MKAKQTLIDYVQNIQRITQPADIELPFNTDELLAKIQQKELIVPVVGAFSAGKSTLINSMLGENLLPTNITAETALATELRYSTENYIEAYTSDSHFERFALSDLEKIKDKSEYYQFLKLFLNNPKLKEIEPLVLVDMPGFESPIANHHQAILNYLNRGVYFIFLTSVLDGTITRSMLQEIHNTQMVGKGYSFCLSKTNLRSPETVAEVRDQLARQLATQCDYHEPIILLGDNGGENLHKILLSINPDALFKEVFLNTLRNNFFQLEENINVKINALNASREENEETKASLEQAICQVQCQKQNEIENLNRYNNGTYVDRIIDSVVNAIRINEPNLISAIFTDLETFKTKLSNIIKDSLLCEINQVFTVESNQTIEEFEKIIGNSVSNLKIFDDFDGNYSDITDDIIETLDSVTDKLEPISDICDVVPTKVTKALSAVHKVMSKIILPITKEISPIIKHFVGDKYKEEYRQQISDTLKFEVIPELRGYLRKELQPQIAQGLSDLISQVSSQFENRLTGYQAEIHQILEKEATEKAQRAEKVVQLAKVREALSESAHRMIF